MEGYLKQIIRADTAYNSIIAPKKKGKPRLNISVANKDLERLLETQAVHQPTLESEVEKKSRERKVYTKINLNREARIDMSKVK